MKALAGRAAAILEGLGVLRALESIDHARDRVAILAYHRIDHPEADPDLDPGLVSATPEDFRAQMELIASRYHAISVADLVAAREHGRRLPRRAVLLTFDDGYRDFQDHAWPILRRLGLPAALFVPTRFADGPSQGFWWDRIHAALKRTREQALECAGIGTLPLGDPARRRAAYRRLRDHVKSLPHGAAMAFVEDVVARLADVPPLHRVLDWNGLRGLAREGLSVCAHGVDHALFTRLPSGDLERELALARARIEAELGPDATPPVLAHPANACDARVVAAVESSGYRLAFGGRRGIERTPLTHPFDLMRLPVLGYTKPLFRAQLRPSVSFAGGVLLSRGA